MKVVFLTAGAAGMYCGSCMHDNALAKALRDLGVDCVLQPVYTPIRTDEDSIADAHVFFGGIHVYLLQQMPWLRFVPGPLRRVLDWPPLLNFATRRVASTDPGKLGELSLSMLRGVHGRQADEFRRLVDWMADEMKPDAVIFSNLLIGGGIPELKSRLPDTKLIVLLQGDDIFLDHLHPETRQQAIELCTELIVSLDHACAHSQFYANKMGELLQIPHEKRVVSRLSIDTSAFHPIANDDPAASNQAESNPSDSSPKPFRLGYLARIAPEKGFHRLVDAFLQIAKDPAMDHVQLHAAGWLGENNRAYFQSQLKRLEQAGVADRFEHHGSPDLKQKIDYLRSLDLLCVPTEYEDPKGLFVLESLAAGTPVVMPDHGAFSELIRSTGGGILVPPGDTDALCSSIRELVLDTPRRRQLAREGREAVQEKHSIQSAAQALRDLIAS
ncbi:glycosyltransferase family 4 protein [Stieleria varia]|uniref:Mannosylfructose-phosphate synthase n=1 Tax=Stieleria varia TaxID=2528005 RepID=A0A5C6AFY1_9BACT|nr:glycosyltransferase family 4 protein [Stieleria varia]TWT98228.1 Mannosylfructose-phosphate synthase [Stieleria varia]